MSSKPSTQFVDEMIEVGFQGNSPLEKTPRCPDRLIWRNSVYQVVEELAEWREFARKGRMSKNMQPQHATRASRVGSWGVGRFHFQVKVESGEIMEVYYDRAPIDVDKRKGGWYLVSVQSVDVK